VLQQLHQWSLAQACRRRARTAEAAHDQVRIAAVLDGLQFKRLLFEHSSVPGRRFLHAGGSSGAQWRVPDGEGQPKGSDSPHLVSGREAGVGHLQRIRPDDQDYIRTVTAIKGEWIIDIAGHYYEMENFPEGSAKRALERLYEHRKRAAQQAKTMQVAK